MNETFRFSLHLLLIIMPACTLSIIIAMHSLVRWSSIHHKHINYVYNVAKLIDLQWKHMGRKGYKPATSVWNSSEHVLS